MSSRLLAEASAGAAGQLVATLLLHPLDTLKTRKQASNANVESLSVRVLYKGLPPKALLSLLSSFVFFYGYEFYKGVLRRARVPLNAIINVFVASLAGANNVLLTQPLDTYVTRIQTGRCKHALQKEKKDEEILKPDEKKEASASHSYYDGLGASLILCVNPGIQYAIFEQLKRAALRGGRSRSLGAASAFVLGALSKSLATLATYPLIRAKVVQQVQRSQAPSDSTAANRESPSIWAVLRNIYVAEGAIGLYRGLDAQIVKTVLGAAIALMLKEKLSAMQARMLRTLRGLEDGKKRHGALKGRAALT